MNDTKFGQIQFYNDIDSEDSLNLSDVSGAESDDESSSETDYPVTNFDFAQIIKKKDSCTSNSTLIGLPAETTHCHYANESSNVKDKFYANFTRPRIRSRHKSSSVSSLSSSEGSFVLTQLTPDVDLDVVS